MNPGPWDAAGRREQPALDALRRAIARVHLRCLARLLAPGGRAILVTDVASAAHLPARAGVTPAGVIDVLDRAGGLFPGTSPASLATLLREDPELATRVGDVQLSTPWRWNLGDGRIYLVAALRFRRLLRPR